MRGKLWFLGGLAAGFVLGARAGRDKYEEIVTTARKIKEHPTVQEATGVVQEQTTKLVGQSKDKLSHSRLADTKIGERLLSSTGTGTSGTAASRDDLLDDTTLAMPSTTSAAPRTTSVGSTGTGSTSTGSVSTGTTGTGPSSTGTTGTGPSSTGTTSTGTTTPPNTSSTTTPGSGTSY
jgi:hypothetical protein